MPAPSRAHAIPRPGPGSLVRDAAGRLAGLDVATLAALADHLDELLWIRDPAGRLSFVSSRSVAVLGQPPARLLAEPDLWRDMVPAEWHDRLVWLRLPLALAHATRCAYPLRTPRGERWVQESCFPVRTGGRLRHLVGATRDMTGTHRIAQALRLQPGHAHDLALRDPLTGLLNRHGLECEMRMLAPGGSARGSAVLLIDCDDFRRITDLHGDGAGDAVLRQIAARLQRRLRPLDVLGRLGGDEFLALLPHTRLDEAVRIGERVRTAVGCLPIVWDRRSLRVTVSIGAGTLPQDCAGIGAALAAADASLLAGKRIGRTRVLASHPAPPA